MVFLVHFNRSRSNSIGANRLTTVAAVLGAFAMLATLVLVSPAAAQDGSADTADPIDETTGEPFPPIDQDPITIWESDGGDITPEQAAVEAIAASVSTESDFDDGLGSELDQDGVTFEAGEPVATFRGGGWGHGVGMSQFGAYGRAADGQNHHQILQHYYEGVSIGSYGFSSTLRVQVGSASTATLAPEGNVDIRINNRVKASATAGQRVVITHNAAGWGIEIDGNQLCAPACTGSALAVTHSKPTPVGIAETGHRYQHGKIQLKPTAPGASSMHIIIAGINVEQYLYGLGEMPSSWPSEALAVQAIAGRSYAVDVTESRRRSSSWNNPFDLFGSTGDQVYIGMTKQFGAQGSRWVAAVDNTRGQYALHGGRPITAFYSSSNGGHSADSEYVFVARLPYLRGKPDPFDGHNNKFASWTRTYSLTDLSRYLGAFSDSNVGAIERIEFRQPIAASGHIDRAEVVLVGSAGRKSIRGSSFRVRVNAGLSADGLGLDHQLLSSNFSFDGIAGADAKPEGRFKVTEKVTTGATPKATFWGWAVDPDTSDPVSITLTIDGRRTINKVANIPRPKVDSRFGLGPRHGFEFTTALQRGRHQYCIWALNVGEGADTNLGCRTFTVASSPVGALEQIQIVFEPQPRLVLSGHVTDPDTSSPVNVDVVLDRRLVNTGRADGPGGAFRITADVTPGPHSVCAFGIDDNQLSPDTNLGCADLTVPDRQPIGSYILRNLGGGRLMFDGWALDPDTSASIVVAATVDGRRVADQVADARRVPLGRRYGLGEFHGVDLEIRLSPGTYRVCLWALNATKGAKSTNLGCRNRTV